ncbi:MAG: pyridoxal 5'-phosphate synthase glutaminase subunit PdxT [Gemmatimonadota bacterium]
MVIGVLGLQGDFEAHARALRGLGAGVRVVKKPEQLEDVQGLIMPGGESTTLIKLMDAYGFWDPLRDFAAAGHTLFGTCAGLILLAAEVSNPPQRSLGLIDVAVERNGYGRQRESFEAVGRFAAGGRERDLAMVFIRAPRLRRLGPGVEPLATLGDECVMARQGRVLVATFHPELTDDPFVHQYFLDAVEG